MEKTSISYALPALLILSLILLFAGLGRMDLRGSTEPREAGIAAEMLQDQDYLLPKLNGEAFLEKPPLSYWLQAANIHIFGYTNIAPRLPSVLAGIGSILLMLGFGARFHQSNRTYSTRAGLVAGLLLLTMASFWMNARQAGQDALLAFGITLSLLSFYAVRESAQPWRCWCGYILGLSIATLAKGVIGLAIPGAAIFVYLIIETIWFERRLVLSHWLLPALFAVVSLLPIALWLYFLYLEHGAQAVRELVWVNSVSRFAGEYTRGSHSEPFYYYLQKLPETFQPWTIPVFVALWQLGKAWRTNRQFVFFACWLIAPFILLSLSSGKRPTYLLALYPAAALLLTAYFEHCLHLSKDKVLHRVNLVQALLFSGIAIAITARLFKIHLPVVAVIFAVVMVAGLFVLWTRAWRDQRPQAFVAAIVVIAVAYVGYGGFILPHEAVKESARPIFDHLAPALAQHRQLVLFNPSERISGAARFYARGPALTVATAVELNAVWEKDSAAIVLIAKVDADTLTGFFVQEDFMYGRNEYLVVMKSDAVEMESAP